MMPVTRLAGPAAAPSASVAASFWAVSLLLIATNMRLLFLRSKEAFLVALFVFWLLAIARMAW
jgi:hypothetical protein